MSQTWISKSTRREQLKGNRSDQHQVSPNNINTSSREKVTRINTLTAKGEMLWSFIEILLTFSVRKCMENSLENFDLDIGDERVA